MLALITTYEEANRLQSSLPTATVPVVTPHVYACSVANQVRACDVHLSVLCVFAFPHAHAKIACNSVCTRQFLKFCTH